MRSTTINYRPRLLSPELFPAGNESISSSLYPSRCSRGCRWPRPSGNETALTRDSAIKDLAVDGELGVQRADCGDRTVVDVGDKPGGAVELRVRSGVHPVEESWREHDVRHVSTAVPIRGHRFSPERER